MQSSKIVFLSKSFQFLQNKVNYKAYIAILTDYVNNKLLQITGVLACLDGYMNIALEQTEEYSNGQLKSKFGDAFIRGNNVLYISTIKRH